MRPESTTIAGGGNAPEPSVPHEIHRLLERIASGRPANLDETAQEELARIERVLGDFDRLSEWRMRERPALLNLLTMVEIAISALLADPPQMKLAVETRKDLEKRTGIARSEFTNVFYRGFPATRVIVGLLIFMALAVALALLIAPSASGTLFGFDATRLLVAAVAGALGSIVSIMVRLNALSGALADQPPSVHVFTGIFKPLSGALFGLFTYVAWQSGILPLSVESGRELYLLAMLTFIAGFSERFVPDLVRRVEDGTSASRPTT